MTSSDRLKILRLLNNHTQQTLAEAAGISQVQIAYLERGKRAISEAAASKLAISLGSTEGYLLTGIPPADQCVWAVQPEGKNLFKDLHDLLPQFLVENGFTKIVFKPYVGGQVTLLSAEDGRRGLVITSSETTSACVKKAAREVGKLEVLPNDHKTIDKFTLSVFEEKGLDEYFIWPTDFSFETIAHGFNKALPYVLRIAIPHILSEALAWAKEAPNDEEFVKNVSPMVELAVEEAVQRIMRLSGDNAIAKMKATIDRAYAEAITRPR